MIGSKDTKIDEKIRALKKLRDELNKYADSFKGRTVIYKRGRYKGRKARITWAKFSYDELRVKIRIELEPSEGCIYLDCKHHKRTRSLDSVELVKS